MPAWPGGPCPDCGEVMPANLLRCQTCRAWLNEDLRRDEPDVPEPFALPEITSEPVPQVAQPSGHYVICPACRRELRVADRFVGQVVACRFCSEPFEIAIGPEADPPRVAFYLDCPHCEREIRARSKYMGQKVLCKHCDGPVQIEESAQV